MANEKKLGRGLDALFTTTTAQQRDQLINDTVPDDAANQNTDKLPINIIFANPYQPRKTFDQQSLQELANSIKKNGIVQPIVVRKIADNNFQIIAGERRFRAAKLINLQQVPVIVKEIDDQTLMQLAIIENLQREDLNVIEEAQGIQTLIDSLAITQEQAAERLGKSRSTIANLLRLLTLPKEIQQLVVQQKLSMGHARALLGIEDAAISVPLASYIIENNLSVRQTEQLVTNGGKIPQKNDSSKSHTTNQITSPNIFQKNISNKLEEKFGTKAVVNDKNIIISYQTLDDLDRILQILDVSINE